MVRDCRGESQRKVRDRPGAGAVGRRRRAQGMWPPAQECSQNGSLGRERGPADTDFGLPASRAEMMGFCHVEPHLFGGLWQQPQKQTAPRRLGWLALQHSGPLLPQGLCTGHALCLRRPSRVPCGLLPLLSWILVQTSHYLDHPPSNVSLLPATHHFIFPRGASHLPMHQLAGRARALAAPPRPAPHSAGPWKPVHTCLCWLN